MGANGWSIGKRKAEFQGGTSGAWITLTVTGSGGNYEGTALCTDESDTFNLIPPQSISRADVYNIVDACVVWSQMVKQSLKEHAQQINALGKIITTPSMSAPARSVHSNHKSVSKIRSKIKKSFVRGFENNYRLNNK